MKGRNCRECEYGEFIERSPILDCGFKCHLTHPAKTLGMPRECIYEEKIFRDLELIKEKRMEENQKLFDKAFCMGTIAGSVLTGAIIGLIMWLL